MAILITIIFFSQKCQFDMEYTHKSKHDKYLILRKKHDKSWSLGVTILEKYFSTLSVHSATILRL